ncbi:hypothetical protein tpqmel_0249 [Candidatus Gastranaerophilus sp. (ex Termes propinquus)]|nr:hypothetical protein tpqmel_0249 [Candidatus Gastranaerophilus sp. (ex Termes propinquus)]
MVAGTTSSFIKKPASAITTEKTSTGRAIRAIPMPQERRTVISEFKLSLLSVITTAKSVEIGIVITNTCGRFSIIIITAMLNGMPYAEICFMSCVKVSEAKIIEVKIMTPKIKISKTLLKMYLSRIESWFIFSHILSYAVL